MGRGAARRPRVFLDWRLGAGRGGVRLGHLHIQTESGFTLQQKGAAERPFKDTSRLSFFVVLVDKICCLWGKPQTFYFLNFFIMFN